MFVAVGVRFGRLGAMTSFSEFGQMAAGNMFNVGPGGGCTDELRKSIA